MVDMSVLNAEAARFEVGEHGFNAPAPAVFQGLQIARRGGQGDDPGSGVTRILDDANIDTGGEVRSWRLMRGPRPFETVFVLPQCHQVGRPERRTVWPGNSPPVSILVRARL